MSEKGLDWDLVGEQLRWGWILALVYEMGWKSRWSQIQAAALVCSESQRFTQAWHINNRGESNESRDEGLLQVNDYWHKDAGNMWNPWENIAYARTMYVASGFSFNQWAAYRSKAYLKYAPLATFHYLKGRWKKRLPIITNLDNPLAEAPPIPTLE